MKGLPKQSLFLCLIGNKLSLKSFVEKKQGGGEMLPEFTVHWFPGHMQKAKREMKENLSLVDLIIEVRDARAPLASANPALVTFGEHKERIVILNKADLADQDVLKIWQSNFPEFMIFSGKSRQDVNRLKRELDLYGQKIKDDWQARRKGLRPFRSIVLGMPNVGKSTIINALSNSSKAKTGQKPGVTRGKQWITLSNGWQLLDTPGVMMPEEIKGESGLFLALINAIDEKLYDHELAALHFVQWLMDNEPMVLEDRYKIKLLDDPYQNLIEIGKKRGCLRSGGRVDTSQAALILLKDFRDGGLGCLSLERPE